MLLKLQQIIVKPGQQMLFQDISWEQLESEETIGRETAIWLRFYDVAGNLVLLPEEAAAAQAQAAAAREEAAIAQAQAAAVREEAAVAQAARLAARLRELGENPDML